MLFMYILASSRCGTSLHKSVKAHNKNYIVEVKNDDTIYKNYKIMAIFLAHIFMSIAFTLFTMCGGKFY